MKLDAFLLADAATATGGKLYVHGGGITRIEAPMIPYVLPTMSIVALFAIEEADEVGIARTFGLRVVGPAGEDIIPRADVQVEPGEEDADKAVEGETRSFQLVLNFGPLNFQREGQHRLQFFADEELVRDMPLPVVHWESASHFVMRRAPEGEEDEQTAGAP